MSTSISTSTTSTSISTSANLSLKYRHKYLVVNNSDDGDYKLHQGYRQPPPTRQHRLRIAGRRRGTYRRHAVLTDGTRHLPTTLPARSMSGPPEFPVEIAASVWINVSAAGFAFDFSFATAPSHQKNVINKCDMIHCVRGRIGGGEGGGGSQSALRIKSGLEKGPFFFKRQLPPAFCPPPSPPSILGIGWVGVGWQRHCCTTCRSLCDLDNQGTVFFGTGGGGSVTAGDRVVDHSCGVESLHSAQEE